MCIEISGELMSKKRNHWDTATVSQFPKWFAEREDSLELLLKVLRREDDPKAQDIEKIFDSVFVVLTEFNQENETKGGDEIEVAEFHGFDTIKEMNEELIKEWGKQEIKFIYNTRKKAFFEVEPQLMLGMKEVESEKEEKDNDMLECPDCGGRFLNDLEPHKKVGNCKQRTVFSSAPLPGLSRDTRPASNEAPPGSMGGPKRSS
jgi:hypothetical protein